MTDPDRQIWDGMLSHLRAHHPTVCRQWFSQLEPLGVGGGQFQIRARSIVQRDYLRRQCAEPFNEAAVSASQHLMSVRFLGPDDQPAAVHRNGHAHNGKRSSPVPAQPVGIAPAESPHAVAAPPAVEPAQSSPAPQPQNAAHRADEYSLALNPDYDFENFVVGPGNRLAHAAALGVVKDPGRASNPLFIHGGVGLGKTHLLQAVCLRILENNPRAVMSYLSCESFVDQFIQAVQANEMADFRHRFRDVDVLVIDDIHFLTKRDRTQEEFFHTFNTLYQARKQIVLSSDARPEEIPDLEGRLVSRFKWGMVSSVEPPCFETRVAILKTKARLRGIELPDDAATYIATVIDTNIRELEGAITKVQILAGLENRPIDLGLTKVALEEPRGANATEPSIHAIMTVVCEYYHVKITDIQSKRRHRSITLPRQVCMSLGRRITRHSLEEIGGHIGGRDHTTVMHALKKIDQRRAIDPDFDTLLKGFEERLRPQRV